MEISRKDKQIRSLQEESLKGSRVGRGSLASSASTQAVSGRGKPHPAATASRANGKVRTGETPLTSGRVGKQGHHGDKPAEYAAMASQADCKPSRIRETPLTSGSMYMGEQAQNGDEPAGEYVAVVSQADCKGRMGKSSLASSGTGKQGCHKSEHGEYAEMSIDSRKGSERHSEIWKRRRGKEEDATAGEEYHRKRGHGRHPFDAGKGGEDINAYRALDTYRASDSQRASESKREKWTRL